MAEYIHTQITSYPQIIFSLIALQPVINSSVFLLLAVIHTHTQKKKRRRRRSLVYPSFHALFSVARSEKQVLIPNQCTVEKAGLLASTDAIPPPAALTSVFREV